MDKDIILKTSFRGFNKKAVMDYIEELQKENLALKARVAELEEMILQDEVEVKESAEEPVVIDAEQEEVDTPSSTVEEPAALPDADSLKDTDDFDKMEAQLDEQFQKLVDEYAGEEKPAEKKGFRIRVRVKD